MIHWPLGNGLENVEKGEGKQARIVEVLFKVGKR